MTSAPKGTSNIQINDNLENKNINKMESFKNNSISVSINSQITSYNSQNTFKRSSRKEKINTIQRPLTPPLFLRSKKAISFKYESFPGKEEGDFDLLFFTKKNENNQRSIKNKENVEDKKIIKNKIEIKEKKIEVKKEQTKNSVNNVNNIKFSDVNKNMNIKTSENNKVNINIQKNIKKKTDKNDNYTQIYSRNDFADRPPKIPSLFLKDYDYENKNIFSHSNDTGGFIIESKKISNVFYNHLLINKKNNKRYIITSLNKKNKGKLLTLLFYTP